MSTKHFALIRSDRINRDDQDFAPVGTSAKAHLSHSLREVRAGDWVIVHAQLVCTHEPEPPDASIAVFTAHLNCNGKRISPYRDKSLQRVGGNHHGSMLLMGQVRADSSEAMLFELVVGSSREQGQLELLDYTHLVVNQYRSLAELEDRDRDRVWAPVRVYSETSVQAPWRTNSETSYETPLFELEVASETGDLIYVSSHSCADTPESRPIFRHRIGSSTKPNLAVVTENLIPGSLHRLTQGCVSMIPGDPSLRLRAEVGTGPSGRTARLLPEFSRLDAVVFGRGIRPTSMLLRRLRRSYPDSKEVLTPDYRRVAVGPSQTIHMTRPGLIRAKTFATLNYTGSQVRSAYARIAITDEHGHESLSTVAARYIQPPYTTHNLCTEYTYQVDEPGSYRVAPYVYCSPTSQPPTADRVTLRPSGSWSFVHAYERR